MAALGTAVDIQEKRRLLQECADLHIVCDDGTRIPCSKYQTCSASQVVKWALETDPQASELPFPTIPTRHLQLALDVIHGMASIEKYTLEEIDAADKGFDVLNANIDTAPRVWELVANAPIAVLLPRLAKLIRSPEVNTKEVLARVIQLTPQFDDIMTAVTHCEPDVETAVWLIRILSKFVPVAPLFKHMLRVMHNLTVLDAIKLVPAQLGVYMHPGEVADILRMLQNLPLRDQSTSLHLSMFIRAMSAGMHTFDAAPLSNASLHGTTLLYSDSPVTSTLLNIEGRPPTRRVTKWLKLQMHAGCEAFIKASNIDEMSQVARCMDVRLFVEVGQEHAELWHCWRAPDWNPYTEVSTMNCQNIRGDVTKFYQLINTGVFARRMRLRIDIYYARESALTHPPL